LDTYPVVQIGEARERKARRRGASERQEAGVMKDYFSDTCTRVTVPVMVCALAFLVNGIVVWGISRLPER
jgi:hypothetical protein